MMPTAHFLNLPREIRDQIYEHVFLSPTSIITPIPIPHNKREPHASFSTNPRFLISFESPSSHDPFPKQYTTLSLLRTCSQVYAEASSLFWNNNTFYFSTAPESVITLPQCFKLMGQTSSRLISSIIFEIEPNRRNEVIIPRSLQVLASRARLGRLEKVEIRLGEGTVNLLSYMREFGSDGGGKGGPYDRFLEILRKGFESVGYERVVVFQRPNWAGVEVKDFEVLCKEVHFVVGGKLVLDGELIWEGFEKKGRFEWEE